MVASEQRIGYVILKIEKDPRTEGYQSLGVYLPKDLAERRADLTRRVAQELEALAGEFPEQDDNYFAARTARVQPLARDIHKIDRQGRVERRELQKGRNNTYNIGDIVYS